MVLCGKAAHSRGYKTFHRQGMALGWKLSRYLTRRTGSEILLLYQGIDGKLMSYDYEEAGACVAGWENHSSAFLCVTFENRSNISTNNSPSGNGHIP